MGGHISVTSPKNVNNAIFQRFALLVLRDGLGAAAPLNCHGAVSLFGSLVNKFIISFEFLIICSDEPVVGIVFGPGALNF